ncbi:hypothetical protein ACHAXT_006559 [Thalassiosira profunda]
MASKHRLVAASALLLLSSASAFVHPHRSTVVHTLPSPRGIQRGILRIRGGDINDSMSTSTSLSAAIGPLTTTLREALVAGSPLRGIGALYAVASATVVPLTWYSYAYSFSVGYGLSIAAMATALLASFPLAGDGALLSKLTASPPFLLAIVALAYGLRLGGFILFRECTVDAKGKQFADLNKKPILQRTPLALGVSLLYAFMMTPALFALRGTVAAGSVAEKAQKIFVGVAAFGTALEAVADAHKYQAKRGSKEGEAKFSGPTSWSYRLCRHPNYLGEIMQWIGLFGAGSVSFGKSIAAWVCSGLGLWGILSIMFMAASSLEKKQAEKYGGQPAFDEWRSEVKSTLIPLIK